MIALWWALVAGAHPLSPSVLRLSQGDDGVQALWQTPTTRPVGVEMVPILPCPPAGQGVVSVEPGVIQTRWDLSCADLSGREVGVEGLVPGAPNVLVEWRSPWGVHTALLHADRTRHPLPTWPSASTTSFEMLWMGVRHLWGGADHVLFVCGLVLLVPRRLLLGAVTAFTAGHAISLGLVGTGQLTLPGAPVEVAIALSLVWLAAEAMSPEPGLVARAPIRLCLPFGLIHGLGFAGAWLELGMDSSTTSSALLGFNLGLELGQLALVLLIWAGFQWFGTPSPRVRVGLAWVGGALAAMWVWQRAALLLG